MLRWPQVCLYAQSALLDEITDLLAKAGKSPFPESFVPGRQREHPAPHLLNECRNPAEFQAGIPVLDHGGRLARCAASEGFSGSGKHSRSKTASKAASTFREEVPTPALQYLTLAS